MTTKANAIAVVMTTVSKTTAVETQSGRGGGAEEGSGQKQDDDDDADDVVSKVECDVISGGQYKMEPTAAFPTDCILGFSLIFTNRVTQQIED